MLKFGIFLITTVLLASQCTTGNSSQWKLAWSDEFEYSGAPDTAIWSYELGYIRNSELQKYTNSLENVRVEDGICIIECKLEDDSTITSGSINTKGKRDIKYGRIEVRAKIPSSLGSWPAIWLLGNNIREVGWPACGEIDIMEHVGYDPLKIHANIHTKAYNHKNGITKGNTIETEEPWSDFHVYAMNWYEERIDFFFDDSLYHSYENDFQQDTDTWPFDKPHYLLINLAFGGGWGGARGVDITTLPLIYEIDYVRYYRSK